jgi:ubiquinone/menaquinone biosynthesis C-methylase UbiE
MAVSHSPDVRPDTAIPDIDDLFRQSADEKARAGFVSVLRNHTKTTMRDRLERHYREKVVPSYQRQHGHPPENGDEVERLLAGNLYYRVYSVIRYNAQKMMFLSAIDPVERQRDAFVERASEFASKRPAGGSLHISPDFEVPKYVSSLDVHLVPGGFHTEYQRNDVAQGVIVSFGGRVSTGANDHRKGDLGGVGRSIATWLARSRPDFDPRRVLDLGTQSGKNLRPYLDVFPGVEAHGIDVCAPPLRYGHAKAEALGKPIHFSQQNAENTDFRSGYFDLIVSSFFFHEVPVKATRRILRECYRLLKPGGVMVHMELPPRDRCDPWQNFYWDWDAAHNNEPFYIDFRSQNLQELVTEAGFAQESFFARTIPNVSTFPDESYEAFLSGEIEAPLHGRGGWFVFGAQRTQ